MEIALTFIMKIDSIKPYEECIGDEFMKSVTFDSEISEAFIYFLSEFGAIEYFASFARPLFTLTIDDCFSFKGVQGLTSGRLTLNPNSIPNHYFFLFQDFIQNGINLDNLNMYGN